MMTLVTGNIATMKVSSKSSTGPVDATATVDAHVLYMDDQNHLVPLLHCYHSTASRSICSIGTGCGGGGHRYPITTLSHVDSYYCTNCFTYYDPIQGTSSPNYGTCTKCYNCPFCFQNCCRIVVMKAESSHNHHHHHNNNDDNQRGKASQQIIPFRCYYKCYNCDYTSKDYCSKVMVELSLLVPSQPPVDTDSRNNELAESSSSSPPTTTTPTIFTKWETLQNTATELLNDTIRQQYHTAASSSSSISISNHAIRMDQWRAYYQQQRENETHRTVVKKTVQQQKQLVNQDGNQKQWSILELETKLQSIQDNNGNNSIQHDNMPSSIPNTNEKDTSSLEIPMGSTIRRTSIHDILLAKQQQPQHQETKSSSTTTDDDTVRNRQLQYKQWENISLLSYLMQSILFDSSSTSTSTADISAPDIMSYYPIPRSLTTRCSYRSKKDVLIHHRPGIVLKPKLNPLDGDTSQSSNNNSNISSSTNISSNMGQWYRKDSSAIYTIPNVHVMKHYDTSQRYDSTNTNVTKRKMHSFLLQVSNPTLGPIRLRLLLSNQSSPSPSLSKYHNELKFWNDIDDAIDITAATSATFHNVLLDPLHHITADQLEVVLESEVATELSETLTTTIELQSMDDTMLLDYPGTSTATNRGSNAIPEIVEQWKSNRKNDMDNQERLEDVISNKKVLRFVAQNTSSAWYELLVEEPVVVESETTGRTDATLSSTSSSWYGIPLVLEIEIGNGSWESSLIPAEPNEEGNDMVQLDLVVACPKNQ